MQRGEQVSSLRPMRLRDGYRRLRVPLQSGLRGRRYGMHQDRYGKSLHLASLALSRPVYRA